MCVCVHAIALAHMCMIILFLVLLLCTRLCATFGGIAHKQILLYQIKVEGYITFVSV